MKTKMKMETRVLEIVVVMLQGKIRCDKKSSKELKIAISMLLLK